MKIKSITFAITDDEIIENKALEMMKDILEHMKTCPHVEQLEGKITFYENVSWETGGKVVVVEYEEVPGIREVFEKKEGDESSGYSTTW